MEVRQNSFEKALEDGSLKKLPSLLSQWVIMLTLQGKNPWVKPDEGYWRLLQNLTTSSWERSLKTLFIIHFRLCKTIPSISSSLVLCRIQMVVPSSRNQKTVTYYNFVTKYWHYIRVLCWNITRSPNLLREVPRNLKDVLLIKETGNIIKLLCKYCELSNALRQCLRISSAILIKNITGAILEDLKMCYKSAKLLVKMILDDFSRLGFEQAMAGYFMVQTFENCNKLLWEHFIAIKVFLPDLPTPHLKTYPREVFQSLSDHIQWLINNPRNIDIEVKGDNMDNLQLYFETRNRLNQQNIENANVPEEEVSLRHFEYKHERKFVQDNLNRANSCADTAKRIKSPSDQARISPPEALQQRLNYKQLLPYISESLEKYEKTQVVQETDLKIKDSPAKNKATDHCGDKDGPFKGNESEPKKNLNIFMESNPEEYNFSPLDSFKKIDCSIDLLSGSPKNNSTDIYTASMNPFENIDKVSDHPQNIFTNSMNPFESAGYNAKNYPQSIFTNSMNPFETEEASGKFI